MFIGDTKNEVRRSESTPMPMLIHQPPAADELVFSGIGAGEWIAGGGCNMLIARIVV